MNTLFSNLHTAYKTQNYRGLQKSLRHLREAGISITVKLTSKKTVLLKIAQQVLLEEAKRRKRHTKSKQNFKAKQQKAKEVKQWVLFYTQIKNSENPKKMWRKLCMANHPDHGGNASIFNDVMTAWNYYKAA